jgi:hypothetical protein
VPLNRRTHRALRLQAGAPDYGFAREAHMIPALVEEFTAAAPSLPIAFLPGSARPSPVFLSGFSPGRYLFVAETGAWQAGYIPAYLRRYPFILGEAGDGGQVLCIDEGHAGFGANEGTPLFTDAGRPSARLAEALQLARRYLEAAGQTDRFCDMLQAFGLLRAVTLNRSPPDGPASSLHGLMTVDEAALEALPDARFLELRQAGAMPALYAHLISLQALDRLNERALALETAA